GPARQVGQDGQGCRHSAGLIWPENCSEDAWFEGGAACSTSPCKGEVGAPLRAGWGSRPCRDLIERRRGQKQGGDCAAMRPSWNVVSGTDCAGDRSTATSSGDNIRPGHTCSISIVPSCVSRSSLTVVSTTLPQRSCVISGARRGWPPAASLFCVFGIPT